MSKMTVWVYSASPGVWFRSYWLRNASSNVQNLTGSIAQRVTGTFSGHSYPTKPPHPPKNPQTLQVFIRVFDFPQLGSGTRVRETSPQRAHASSSAGSRLLTTRLWLIFSDVSTLQHMVPPTPRLENQPPTIGHSRKVVLIQTEASLPTTHAVCVG